MKIKLKDLKPNPYRDMKHYPINAEKLAQLRASIKKTGFWDNIAVRKSKANGDYEIAYGHHRLLALNKEFGGDHEIQVSLKEWDDPDMIRVMADENDEWYGVSPIIINETVKVARDYLRAHPEAAAGAGEDNRVAKFLGWSVHRVRYALAALADIENGDIDRKTYEKFSSQAQADEFRKEAKRIKLTPTQQAKLADKVVSGQKGYRQMKHEALKVKYAKKKEDAFYQKKLMLDDVAVQIARDLGHVLLLMDPSFLKFWSYVSIENRREIGGQIKEIISRFKKIKEDIHERLPSK